VVVAAAAVVVPPTPAAVVAACVPVPVPVAAPPVPASWALTNDALVDNAMAAAAKIFTKDVISDAPKEITTFGSTWWHWWKVKTIERMYTYG
jgi:hypothetical protein